MSECSEGICGDGAAILCDGQMMTITEVVATLNSHNALVEAVAWVMAFQIID